MGEPGANPSGPRPWLPTSGTPRDTASSYGQALAVILAGRAPALRLSHDAGFHTERIHILLPLRKRNGLVTGSVDGSVRLRDMASGACVRVLPCHDGYFRQILIAPSEDRMITTAAFGRKKVWYLDTGACLADLPRTADTPVCCNDTHFSGGRPLRRPRCGRYGSLPGHADGRAPRHPSCPEPGVPLGDACRCRRTVRMAPDGPGGHHPRPGPFRGRAAHGGDPPRR